jgi:hypothetical protein
MQFKAYDILSSLVPGFLLLLGLFNFFEISYDKDQVIPYTALAFFLGYLANTISSWLEDFYFWTWGGKPSDNLLNGKTIWKVRFHEHQKTVALLKGDTTNPAPSNSELFNIAMREANFKKDPRVEDFNASYAFSRVLLTASFVITVFLLIKNYNDWRYYTACIPTTVIVWLRTKQRGYYYAKEILNVYLKSK